MTARLALITLAGLAPATPGDASEPAASPSGDIGIKLRDVLVTSIREGRVVGTGRTDARGDFRLAVVSGTVSLVR